MTVPTSVSCPCPAEVVWMVAVTAPPTSTLMRQHSTIGGGLVLRIEQRLEGRIGAARLEAGGDADAGEQPLPAQPVALRDQRCVVRARQHLVDHGVVVAAVVGRAARDQIGKLLGADQVAPAHLQPIEPAMPGHLLDRALDGVVGRRLAEGAHRLLHRLVGGHGDGAVLHALDAIGPDDRADRLAELERRAPGIGADIVERAHLHRADHAGIVEGDLDVEVALRPMARRRRACSPAGPRSAAPGSRAGARDSRPAPRA